MGIVTLTPDTVGDLTPVEPPRHPAQLLEWLNLLDLLKDPAAPIERALAEVERIQRRATRPSCKAAVLGTNRSGLLAALLLRLRGAEVVTLGRVFQPLLSENRAKGLPAWKHVWMRPVLTIAQVVEEIGAQWASTSQLTLEPDGEKLGPFDVIMMVSSADSSPVIGLTRRLAEGGVLVDLTLGTGALEFWTATPTPCLLVKHQVRYEAKCDDSGHAERAVRALALADALYPGWLARLLAHDTEDSSVTL